VSVAAVRGKYLSPLSDDRTITLTGVLSYQEYETHLLKTYGSMSLNGSTTYFNDVSIDGDTLPDKLFVIFYFDKPYLESFLKMISDKNSIELELAKRVSETANYYNKDVFAAIVYSDIYYDNPTQFATNNLYTETVTYDEDKNRWDVYYPYVGLEYKIADKTYAAEWAY